MFCFLAIVIWVFDMITDLAKVIYILHLALQLPWNILFWISCITRLDGSKYLDNRLRLNDGVSLWKRDKGYAVPVMNEFQVGYILVQSDFKWISFRSIEWWLILIVWSTCTYCSFYSTISIQKRQGQQQWQRQWFL